jgi:hypothetical protein
MDETTRSVESSIFCSGAWLWPREGIMLSGFSVADHGLGVESDDDEGDDAGAMEPRGGVCADLEAR